MGLTSPTKWRRWWPGCCPPAASLVAGTPVRVDAGAIG
jgi:hypothetical protein